MTKPAPQVFTALLTIPRSGAAAPGVLIRTKAGHSAAPAIERQLLAAKLATMELALALLAAR